MGVTLIENSFFSVPVHKAVSVQSPKYDRNGQRVRIEFPKYDAHPGLKVKNRFSKPTEYLRKMFREDDVVMIKKKILPQNELELTSIIHMCAKYEAIMAYQYFFENYNLDTAINRGTFRSNNKALHMACFYGKPRMLEQLLNHPKIDLKAKSRFDETPLESIATGKKKHPEMAKVYDECQILFESTLAEERFVEEYVRPVLNDS